jgi:toxin ParE1/3/4
MPNPITKSPQAYSDLIDIACYIARESIEASERFLNATQTTLEKLARTPEIGSICPFQHQLAAGIRVWPVQRFKRYLVFYRPESKGINVVRVLHGARDWQSIFEHISGD